MDDKREIERQSRVIADLCRHNNELEAQNNYIKVVLYRVLTGEFSEVITPETLAKIEDSAVSFDAENNRVEMRVNGQLLIEKTYGQV